jgi:YaiO family outer membrane protein
LFPDLRYGAELYKSLPHSLELSAGFRTLKYSTTTNIYTGSIGWYTGNSYWSLRPYFTPEMEEQAHQQPSIIVNIEVTQQIL